MSRRNLFLMFACGIIAYVCHARAEQNPYARFVSGGYSVIDRRALEEVPDQVLFEGAMRGMVAVLNEHGDEHSWFVNQQQRDAFQEDLSQEFGGVGVRIRMLGKPPMPTVLGPPEPGTPAYAADVRSGDRIVAIDTESTAEMDMLEILTKMRGPVGSPVELELKRLGTDEPIKVSLTRAMIMVDSIYGFLRNEKNEWEYLLERDPRIGYMQINQFGEKTEEEIIRTLATLKQQGMEALILDVRDNSGGSLDAAVGMTELFLRAGKQIVTIRGRDGTTAERFVSTGRGGYTDMPLAVLINHHSASASEILAACLQDYGRAIVVGQRTYGKGTVQSLLRLEAGRSLLKLTTATYWRPSGKNIHRMKGASEDDDWGVKPDAGAEVILDDKQYQDWQRYRRRRNLFGEKQNGPVVDQVDAEDGKPPAEYVDRALDLSVVALGNQLDRATLPNP